MRRNTAFLIAVWFILGCDRQEATSWPGAPKVGTKVVLPATRVLWLSADDARMSQTLKDEYESRPAGRKLGDDPRYQRMTATHPPSLDADTVVEVMEIGTGYARVQWIDPTPGTAQGKTGYTRPWW